MKRSTESDSALQFPCDFPLKVMGLNQPHFERQVLELARKHAPELNSGALRIRYSQGNKYISITLTLRAQSQAQLDALYRDLSACPDILMAL